MAYGRYVQEYQKSAVNGSSPLQLVIMLYDGALRFMELGKHALINGDLVKQNDYLQRAQKIIVELMSCLDMEQGGDIAKNLGSIYGFIFNELVSANIKDQIAPIDSCISIMSNLRESWVEIDRSHRAANEETALAA